MTRQEYLKARTAHHLSNQGAVSERGAKSSKNGKRSRKRSNSRSYRFARALARKDTNVHFSSHGKYAGVDALETVRKSRPKKAVKA